MNRKLLRKYLVLFLATTTFISQSISLTKAEEIIPTMLKILNLMGLKLLVLKIVNTYKEKVLISCH